MGERVKPNDSLQLTSQAGTSWNTRDQQGSPSKVTVALWAVQVRNIKLTEFQPVTGNSGVHTIG